MQKTDKIKLSRRQQQIMDVIYRLGEATVKEIQENLPESPTSGAIRRMLNVLLRKGAVDSRQDGAKKVYTAKTSKRIARDQALWRVVHTFFSGSAAGVMASLLNQSDLNLTPDEKQVLNGLIEKAKERGR